MKTASLAALAALWFTGSAFAAPYQFHGSDTLLEVVADSVTKAGLSEEVQYLGGGSGVGEAALVAGTQGIAPMSRAFKPEQIAAAQARGVLPGDHVVGLDGVVLLVHSSNGLLGLTLDTIAKIYTCAYTKWQEVPRSGRTGDIKAYRRNDASGTTDAFKSLAGIAAFGTCVTIVDSAEAIVVATTTTDPSAIGYSGLSGVRTGNHVLAVARTETGPKFMPTEDNIRAFSYPLARSLHVYEASGSAVPNPVERELLDKMLDRNFLDPLLTQHDFITLN